MAWEEWEQLKATALDRHSAQMRLNSLPMDREGGGTSGARTPSLKLRSDRKAWSAAGEGIGELRDTAGKARTELEDGQTGLDTGPGCLTAAAQKGVYDSWERRVKDISELCDGLADVLEKAGNDQLRTDESIKAEITKLRVRFEGGSVAMGPRKGR
ncbi:hypothetical protein [Streptomyces sp. NPDC005423]|uniref:hypothetical protein n=1 Tax=Streptomyces sp. NPDC005423 TaxID=3155343 RepID=UPI0033B5111C